MVTRLTLGNAVNAQHQVPHPSTRFAANDKTIYASVITMGSSSKAILTARWSYLRGEGELFSNISQPIATDGPATTTFEVRNPDRWPVGKYEVVILLDGKPVATQEFEITKR